jgi:transposase
MSSHVSADTKHAILLEYQPRSGTHSFIALARRHGVKGGADVVRHWHDRWNGTAASLQEKHRSGRPRTLTPAEVSRHIRAPILAANRAHRPVSYTDLLPEVRRKTRKQLSLRTLQQYGKETLGVKQKHTKKRTADEGECMHTRESE